MWFYAFSFITNSIRTDGTSSQVCGLAAEFELCVSDQVTSSPFRKLTAQNLKLKTKLHLLNNGAKILLPWPE
jgi:hypothetical protein